MEAGQGRRPPPLTQGRPKRHHRAAASAYALTDPSEAVVSLAAGPTLCEGLASCCHEVGARGTSYLLIGSGTENAAREDGTGKERV